MSSGGHFNPAVTLGVLLAGGINVVASLCYFLVQLVGGIVGAACVLVSPCIQIMAVSLSFSLTNSVDCVQ